MSDGAMKWRVTEVREKARGCSAMWKIRKSADASAAQFYASNKRPWFARLLAEAQAQCDEYNKRETNP